MNSFVRASVLVAFYSVNLFAACGEATLVNQIQRVDAFYQSDKFVTASRPYASGTLFRQVGVRVPFTDEDAAFQVMPFLNTGAGGAAGDRFVPVANSARKEFRGRVNQSALSTVGSNALKYLAVYAGCVKNGGNFDLGLIPDRQPDCSGGNTCYEKRREGTVADASAAGTSCTDAGFTTNGYSLSSETTDTYSVAIPAAGNTTVVCRRIQDIKDTTTTPNIYARWVRYEVTGTGGGSCAYGYEDTATRCYRDVE